MEKSLANFLWENNPPKITPSPWLSMRVNHRHPLARGLVACYLPLSPSRWANIAMPGAVMVPGSATVLRPSMIGGGLLMNAANTLTTTTAPSYLKVSSVTIGSAFVQQVTPSSVDSQILFGIPVPADAVPYVRYAVGTKLPTTNYTFFHSLGGSIVELDTGVSAANGVRRSLVGRATTGAQSVWLDGTSRATGTVAGSITFGGSDVLAFGYPVVPLRYSGANIQIGVIWDRTLLDEEIQLFDRDPFCFLEPDIDGAVFKAQSISGYTLNALPGSYSISGANASLLASRKLNALPGSYSISGANASLLASRKLNALPGSYSISGANASLLTSRKLNALPGSYSISGANASLLASRKLNALPGSYNITGATAQLTYSGSVAAIFGYYALEQALRTVLQSNSVGAFKYFIEGQDNDIQNLSNMPLVNIRIQESTANLVGIPNKYYETVAINIDVYAFDFTSYRDASRIRSSIIGAIRDVIIANKSFYSFLDMTLIEPGIQFDSGVLDGGKGHVAMATMTIMCGAYIN